MTCTQPGCPGSIVDGYCDVCGSPGGTTGTAAAPAPTGQRAGGCRQPGCSGTIVDGYCDVCGSPGDVMPTSASGAASPPAPADDGEQSSPLSTITRGSSRLGSAAIGSQRAGSDGSSVTKRVSSSSQRLRSARLGAGLTRVPPAPQIDASTAIMAAPVVPENKRVCPTCGSAVGRSRDGQPGRTEGFCPTCGSRFSFTPKLQPGDLVAHQYAVAGCLAHGGLGWIYLAKDKNVSDRWVVLKGLLNTGDADALAVAIVEKQFLAQVEHPLIVEIYNFVSHDGAGYIVMEYVGGVSLKDILKDRMRKAGGTYHPLPVDQALAYILEVLPAFQYLHDLGLVYCDFKPDNLIQIGDAVKLIDLGGVRRLDDHDSAIYGTVGYQAPEVPQVGTSIASDIYTIGRTLLVLMAEFRGYQTRYVDKLPPPEEIPLFAAHDSLYRLVAKMCAPDPADRFASVDELRVQLLGVLREVVAERQTGTALTSAASVLFEAPAVVSDALAWDQLPALRADTTDGQYAWLSNITADDPKERLAELKQAPTVSPEVQLARARAALQAGWASTVTEVVNQMLTLDPWEWRAVWMSGLLALQQRDLRAAQSAFNAVYGQVPGELAPKLALALACELGGEPDLAERLYRTCASTDANYVAPAAFGLARVRAGRQDVPGAVQALDLVPSTSRNYPESQRQKAELLYASADGLPMLAQAMDSIARVRMDPVDKAVLSAKILERALATVEAKGPNRPLTIGGIPADEPDLRDGLEATYRTLASATDDDRERYALVDKANAVRRWTLT